MSITVLNVSAFIVGIIFIYLASIKDIRSNYFLLILTFLNISMHGLLGLYADMIRDIVITLPLGLYALSHWNRMNDERMDMKINIVSTPIRFNVAIILGTIFIWFALFNVVVGIQETLPGLNTLIVALNLAYMVYHSKIYKEAWMVYIALNILYVMQYLLIWGPGFNFNVIVVKNIIYTFIAMKGLREWIKLRE